MSTDLAYLSISEFKKIKKYEQQKLKTEFYSIKRNKRLLMI